MEYDRCVAVEETPPITIGLSQMSTPEWIAWFAAWTTTTLGTESTETAKRFTDSSATKGQYGKGIETTAEPAHAHYFSFASLNSVEFFF